MDYPWDADPAATWYQILVSRDNQYWQDPWFHTGSTSGLVAVAIDGHRLGRYTWWIRARGPEGYGPWSDRHEFSVGEAVPLNPAGALGGPPAEIRWDDTWASAEATACLVWLAKDGLQYRVWERNQSETQTDGAERYFLLSEALPSGSYTGWIRTSNALGDGPLVRRHVLQRAVARRRRSHA